MIFDRRAATDPRQRPQFAQERLAPNSAQWEAEARFPREIFAEMGELGFMGTTVPAERGGAGADNVAYSLALQEIAAGDGAVATVVAVTTPRGRHADP